jgi:serine/threonine protein kinase
MPRWTAVSESAYAWEAEAIAWLSDRLPDSEAYRGWSNLELVAQDGAVNEIDALILTPTKILLVEIKSRPGKVEGDSGAWTWTWPDGRREVIDNPLLLANRKAKRLAGLLRATKALKGTRVPFVEELVFLSHKDAREAFKGPAGTRVFVRSAPQGSERDLAAYIQGCAVDANGERMDWAYHRAVLRAFDELQIRPVQRQFTAGQWKLGPLIEDAGIYQDYIGEHTKLEGSKRRVRVYPWPASGPETGRRSRREAATREFRLLDRADMHPGILRAQALEETERGPAVVFEHPDPSERLDAFLVRRAPALDLRQRLRLVRELADALTWAHSQGMYHRTLTPAAVLVVKPDDEAPQVRILNWQVGSLAESTVDGGTLTWHDFLQVGLAGREAHAVYLAPELRGGGRADAALLDVFSLGALAYHVLTGRAPAQTAEELLQRLRDGRGLRLAAALDGIDEDLDALVQLATSPDLADRPSAADFLRDVEAILGALAQQQEASEPGRWIHPMDAEQGAELEGGFVVQRRLGSGSTALALQVERDGRKGVLKVARDPQLNERLRHEGEILRRLRHQHIVELYDVVEVSGHVALFIELAGEQTLAERLRKEGALTLDLLQRFGEELLAVVDWLEQQGIPHRDLKPDNVGVGETRVGKLTLKLFDFSLSATPADNIRAGTPGYLDPFLEERKPRRWDASAERYAAAITLHELATGSLPVWGDGRQHPITLATEATASVATERFDPAVREGLARFFATALSRDPKQRFDTAEGMRSAWHDVFRTIDVPVSGSTSTSGGGSVDVTAAIAAAEPATPLAVLGLTPRVLNALERLGVHRVSELAELPRTKLYGNIGIGLRTVREIRDLADTAARSLADRGLGTPIDATGGDAVMFGVDDDAGTPAALDPALWHLELLVRDVVNTRLVNPDQRVLRLLTGLDAPADADGPDLWPSQRDVAEEIGLSRSQVSEVLDRARARWTKKKSLTALRDDVARLLDQSGGVATREELARALARIRGTTAVTDQEQQRTAGAVLWAALEVEGSRETTCRFRLQRGERLLVVVSTMTDSAAGAESLADPGAVRAWVEKLGERADELSESDPPLAPQRVLEDLQSLEAPTGIAAPSPERLLRLAVSASEGAALTPRQELYRRGLPAGRAVALAAGSLLGAANLTADQVRQRVSARFPQAQELPGRPELDRLLDDAGVPLRWDDSVRRYVLPQSRSSLSTSATQTRTPGASVPHATGSAVPDSAAEEVRDFEQRVEAVAAEGRFLVLTIDPSSAASTEAALRDRYGFASVSLERLLIEAIREQATALGVQWPVVLDADRSGRGERAWRNLQMLAQKARPAVEQALRDIAQPTVLVNAGLLARYDLLSVLEPLQERSRRGPGVIVLITGSAQHTMPMVDDVALPVVHPSDWARVPRRWYRLPARVA